jgi:hypothetical protein
MDRFKSIGEYVEDEPMLRVAQLNPLHVEVIVPVDYLGRIVPGMRAHITPAVEGLETYQAKVERVDRVADAASGTYGVRLSLPNPDYKIPAGLRCRMGFLSIERQQSAEIADAPNPGSDNAADTAPDQASTLDPDTANKETKLEPSIAMSADLPSACYTIGPIADKTLVSRLSDQLKGDSTSLRQRQENIKTKSRFLVLAAPEPDRKATRRLIQRLKLAGITDRQLLSGGKHQGRVSLGLYNTQSHARKRQQQLADRGFKADILPFHAETTRYWLEITAVSDTDLTAHLDEITTDLPAAVSLQQTKCSQRLAQH